MILPVRVSSIFNSNYVGWIIIKNLMSSGYRMEMLKSSNWWQLDAMEELMEATPSRTDASSCGVARPWTGQIHCKGCKCTRSSRGRTTNSRGNWSTNEMARRRCQSTRVRVMVKVFKFKGYLRTLATRTNQRKFQKELHIIILRCGRRTDYQLQLAKWPVTAASVGSRYPVHKYSGWIHEHS
jgi:hypothetical protein